MDFDNTKLQIIHFVIDLQYPPTKNSNYDTFLLLLFQFGHISTTDSVENHNKVEKILGLGCL